MENIVEKAPWWGLGEDDKEHEGMLEEAPGETLIDIWGNYRL